MISLNDSPFQRRHFTSIELGIMVRILFPGYAHVVKTKPDYIGCIDTQAKIIESEKCTFMPKIAKPINIVDEF